MTLAGGHAAPTRLRLPALLTLTALGLLPLLPVASAALPALAPFERLVSAWFDLHCERDPARTLVLLGVPLGVCARCSGIYFGLGLGALLRWPRLSPRGVRLWVGGAALVMVLDVALEARGIHGPWAGLRVATGLLLAYPVGSALARLTDRR